VPAPHQGGTLPGRTERWLQRLAANEKILSSSPRCPVVPDFVLRRPRCTRVTGTTGPASNAGQVRVPEQDAARTRQQAEGGRDARRGRHPRTRLAQGGAGTTEGGAAGMRWAPPASVTVDGSEGTNATGNQAVFPHALPSLLILQSAIISRSTTMDRLGYDRAAGGIALLTRACEKGPVRFSRRINWQLRRFRIRVGRTEDVRRQDRSDREASVFSDPAAGLHRPCPYTQLVLLDAPAIDCAGLADGSLIGSPVL
jgi:hypothetical protein